jgi:hypothetical protein
VSGSFRYGDNGTFRVTVSVTDKDGGSGSAGFDVTVRNVAPVIGAVATGVADVGSPASVSLELTDPGSDDLTATWVWGDGSPDTVQTSLVNPPDADPPVSPSVQPRDIDVATTHTFGTACLYDVGPSVVDDDGGTADALVPVVITAAPSLSRGAGYWQTAYKGLLGSQFTNEQLQCYIDIAAFMSTVFNEARDASTIPLAHNDIFVAGLKGRVIQQLDRQLLTAWINFANGGVELDELLDTDGDGTLDTSYIDVMTTAEAIRNAPGSTKAQLETQRDILMRINGRDGL